MTTHYAELKEWASGRDGVANAATGFDVETDSRCTASRSAGPGTSHALRDCRAARSRPGGRRGRARSRRPERLRAAELVAEAEASERAAREQP